MSIFDELLAGSAIPPFAEVEYHIPSPRLADPAAEVALRLRESGLLSRLRPGQSVCIGVGSREIANLSRIVRTLADAVKSTGAQPFIIPAMGSHGGATAAGQLDILAGYDITPQAMGVPVRATMETVKLGRTESGLDVHMDKNAAGADWIIPVGRVKPHTDFRGPIESGLSKMLTIGFGKQHGAEICHNMGFFHMSQNIQDITAVILAKMPVLLGLAIVENTHHETAKIAVVPGAQIPAAEPPLLEEARSLMATIPFRKADLLILDEIGKNISGAGMDPNVTGRSTIIGRWQPDFENIVVLDLTDVSHGNGTGLGNADVTTRRVFDKFSFEMTYPNCFTCNDGLGVKLPIIMPNDELAIRAGIRLCQGADPALGLRAVWIENTLELEHFHISPALLPEAEGIAGMRVLGPARPVCFDAQRNVASR